MLSEGHSVTLRAKGSSMFPFIVGGRDNVTLQKAVDVQVGDIVLAHLPDGRYVLHRIYHTDGTAVVLMGDGNVKAYERCHTEDLCGMVVTIIRKGRCVSCRSPRELRKASVWRMALPIRRYLLAVWKRWRGNMG